MIEIRAKENFRLERLKKKHCANLILRYFDYHKILRRLNILNLRGPIIGKYVEFHTLTKKVVLVASILQLKKKLIERYLLTQYIIIKVSIRVKDGDIQSVLFPHTVPYTIVNFKRSKLLVKK